MKEYHKTKLEKSRTKSQHTRMHTQNVTMSSSVKTSFDGFKRLPHLKRNGINCLQIS